MTRALHLREVRFGASTPVNAEVAVEDWVANDRDMVGGMEVARSDGPLLSLFPR